MADLKKIGILFPAMRISLALVMLTACLFLSAEFLGFAPDESKFQLSARKQISEALAIQFTLFAPTQDPKNIQKMLSHVVKRNPEIETAGIRLTNGELIFQVGNHASNWQDYEKNKSTSTHVIVPLLHNNELWGNIELKYKPLGKEPILDFYQQPLFRMASYILIVGFFTYLAFMIRALKILDPSAVVPERVNAAFDTLTEGIVILDEKEQIVLVNKAINEKLARPMSPLIGVKLSSLPWKHPNSEQPDVDFPWQTVLKSGKSSVGTQLMLMTADSRVSKFVINASPIQSENETTQGVLITLDDITEIEERNTALQTMVSHLEETKAQIQLQNKELNFLATRDSLTGCLNRRTFSEQFDKLFNDALEMNKELSYILADLDHFKAVNDNYGHAVGDDVIKLFAEVLLANTRKLDIVGRYGGEEFCVALPGLTIQEASVIAERLRLRIKDESTKRFKAGPRVTSSFGVASIKDKPSNSDELSNFADQALYAAKDAGRNRVVCWQAIKDSGETTALTDTAPKNTPQNNDHAYNPETANVIQLQERVTELESIASQFSAELEYNKYYDNLTGLPNHILFYDRIGQVIERGNRYDQLAAILIIDIGILSQINTTLGRKVGDNLLLGIAERLKCTFRKYDGISRLTVSRFGGDEFAVLLTDLTTKEAVTWIINRLLDALSAPIEIENNSLFLACHVGVSLYPTDGNSAEDLINFAMTANKYSKQSGTDTRYQFYDDHMQKLSVKQVNLDKELRRAIEHEEWELLYQPKMDIKSRVIVGVEALIRWKHPSRGLLSPFEFVDFAEQRGLIVPIGDWVIKTACQQIKEWTKTGITDCKIAVNLSAVQLRQEDFVTKVLQKLDEAGVPPRLLELEVTESTLMNNFNIALTSLKRLNSRGITIAIDDFGTGYSSLSYLKNLPINTLKIDRAFVKDICTDEKDKQIVNALITMAHSMEMTVVAEGVEEQKQLDILTFHACDEIQGYLLSKPVPASQLTEMLSKPHHLM